MAAKKTKKTKKATVPIPKILKRRISLAGDGYPELEIHTMCNVNYVLLSDVREHLLYKRDVSLFLEKMETLPFRPGEDPKHQIAHFMKTNLSLVKEDTFQKKNRSKVYPVL